MGEKAKEALRVQFDKRLLFFLILGILFLVSGVSPAIAKEASVTASFTVPLTISNISVSGISYESYVVTWDTNGDATSQVFYDKQVHNNIEDYAYRTAEEISLISQHSVKLTGTSSSTTYHYRVQSRIPGTYFAAVSNDYTFTTSYQPRGFSPPPPSESPLIIPAPTTRILQVLIEGKDTGIKVGFDGTVQEASTLSDATGNFVININKGAKINGPGETILERLELSRVEKSKIEELVNIPQNVVALSPAYKITGYSDGKEVSQVNFEPNAIVTINYDPKDLPENALPPFIVNFIQGGSLARLELPPGSIFELGKAKGGVYHASYFAVMTEVVPPPPPLPAHFKSSNLMVNPIQVRLGEPVSIKITIANDGAVTGSYELYLVIDGIIRSVKEITLEPKSITTVSFEVSSLATGEHQVKIAGLSGKFRVISMIVTPAGAQVDWHLIDMCVAALLVVGLLATYLAVRESQSQGI